MAGGAWRRSCRGQCALTVLRRNLGAQPRDTTSPSKFQRYSGDGPSAGRRWSWPFIPPLRAYQSKTPVAMTGGISIRGAVKPVGGVVAKIEAAAYVAVKQQ